MSTTAMRYCVSFDIAYLWKLGDDELGRCLYEKTTGRKLTAAEVREHLTILAGRGFDSVPVCDNHDDKGRCQGHPIEPEPEPVPLRFCEPQKLVDQLRIMKSLNLANEAGTRIIVSLMTRGFIYQPMCDNHDNHGLCLGHPEGEGGGA